jgi:hypothetical protein
MLTPTRKQIRIRNAFDEGREYSRSSLNETGKTIEAELLFYCGRILAGFWANEEHTSLRTRNERVLNREYIVLEAKWNR